MAKTARPDELLPLSDADTAGRIAAAIKKAASALDDNVAIMEVCGTHTVSIAMNGIRSLLPGKIRLLSGPGCPVCVTAPRDVDRLHHTASRKGVLLATFGDMVKVRGSLGSLESCREKGADIRVVYSPLDAVELAAANPSKKVVFAGVGFETTAPAIAAAVLDAEKRGLKNFYVYPLLKLVPPALEMVLGQPGHRINGLLLPGHVSAVIGLAPYQFAAESHNVPCVVAGFEALDILRAIHMLLLQISEGKAAIENEYGRAVPIEGNPSAMQAINSVFVSTFALWRAIGVIPESGLKFRPQYARFDAESFFSPPEFPNAEPMNCRCGSVLMGLAAPSDCRLFGKACTPENPVGPCMVSSEGACAAWYRYGQA